MKRIDSANKSVDLFGAGKHGFRDGNKALGINPTELTADFFNHLQEEVSNVIEGAGIALDTNNRSQLKTAIENMIKGGDYKASVRAASTAAINLAAPGPNIDDVAMVAGDRFLEKDNATLEDRGIYIWNGSAVPATRAPDADAGDEFNGGAIIPVEEGTINADTNWQVTNNGVVIIGTSLLTFKEFNNFLDASETIKGKAQIATQSETNDGLIDNKIVTPLKLETYFRQRNITSFAPVNLTNQTAVNFDPIPSWVKKITISFSGLSVSGSNSPLIQLGDSGGYETSGYTSSSSAVASTVSTVTSTAGFIVTGAVPTLVLNGSLTLTKVSDNTWSLSGVQNNAGNTLISAGAKTLSAALDKVRFYINGTDQFDAGTATLSYE